MKVFCCFPAKSVDDLNAYLNPLKRQRSITLYYSENRETLEKWTSYVIDALGHSDALLVFIGSDIGSAQEYEVATFLKKVPSGRVVVVFLLKERELGSLADLHNFPTVCADHSEPEETARQIGIALGLDAWQTEDGLPIGYPFDYEKDIIKAYVDGKRRLPAKYARLGCSPEWPEVELKRPQQVENPGREPVTGRHRSERERILPDARLNELGLGDNSIWHLQPNGISFLEAGPRRHLRNWRERLKVGVVVSGGIAPGINAVIDGIVTRHANYESWSQGRMPVEVLGYPEGFRALLENIPPRQLHGSDIKRRAEEGGAMIATSRPEDLLATRPGTRTEAFGQLLDRVKTDKIRILYVIGGDGSMRCAHALQLAANEKNVDLAVVGIPKTMDNDILWVWQAFGFLSAVEKAREAILNLHTEVQSNPRLAIIQLFGSDSGFVASHASYSAACDLVLIPEDPLTMEQICSHLGQRLVSRYDEPTVSPHALAVMSETALPKDVGDWYRLPWIGLSGDELRAVESFVNERRVRGQTPDALRTAGLRVVSRVLQRFVERMPHLAAQRWQADWEQAWDHFRQNLLQPDPPTPYDEPARWDRYWKSFRVVCNEPRHLIRSIRPSVNDVIFGERLGTLAVDNAMAGYRGFMVSQWLTEFVLVPLSLVVMGRKRVPPEGIFWKSVRAKTGQPTGLPGQ